MRGISVRAWCAVALLALAGGTQAAEPSVPFVPTPPEVVERMLQIAKVGPQDYLIDLGSGDGRIVVTAARKYGARGFGVDLNPVRIKESVENAAQAGVSDRVTFLQRNLFETDLSNATVITMYLLPRVNCDLQPRLLELKPGTRIVSHDFSMNCGGRKVQVLDSKGRASDVEQHDWKPDAYEELDVKEKYGSGPGRSAIYFWVVPAKVAGIWNWQLNVNGKPQTYELTLEQNIQMVSGTARVGGRSVKLENARLRGDELSFAFTADVNGSPIRHEFTGSVSAGTIDGTVSLAGARTQSRLEWSATRGGKTGARDDSARIAAAVR